jgi:hypothetical protein
MPGHDFIYERTDIPPGMTCDEYRRVRAERLPPRRRMRALRTVRRAVRLP